MRCKKRVHADRELCVAFAQCGDFRRRDARAPLQPLTKSWFVEVKVAGMDTRCLPCLNGRINLEGLIPPLRINFDSAQSKSFQLGDGGVDRKSTRLNSS